MIKRALSILLLVSCAVFSYSQNTGTSASVANRRTAVRYLQLAKQYASEKSWAEADSNAKLGLAYDDKIADLWYLRAVSQRNMNEKKSLVISLVEKALTESEWVDYNKDNARILYADLLSMVRKFDQAVSVLNSEPFIYSADAEYIRARCFYSMGGEENFSKARFKIDAARRVYPNDVRFPQLFYRFEHLIRNGADSVSDSVQKLADAFFAVIPVYKNLDSDTEVLAAAFCSDKSKRERILKSFNAKHLSSVYYAVEGLKNNLLDEHSALDYFYKYADEKISFSVVREFIPLIKNDGNKLELGEYLNSYNGTILFDTDGDFIYNMSVVYNRGRPQQIFYDENQDDNFEWTAECDFGVPLVIHLAENATDITYSNWPFIAKAVYKMEESSADLTFELVAETLSWTPFTIDAEKIAKEALSVDFFIPVLSDKEEKEVVTGKQLLKAAMSYEIPSKERKDAVIKVSILNGVPQVAEYSCNGNVYAVAMFQNGLPVSRTVDVDGDGMFETTEVYGFSADLKQNFISDSDEMQIITNLFGAPAKGTGFYVKSIQIDQNCDTVPDFTEEYTAGRGKVSSWDLDADGNWDVRYVKYPEQLDGVLREDACFHQPLSNSVVTVSSENGIPVLVKDGDRKLSVTRGSASNFYWIGENRNPDEEEKIIKSINQIESQGVSILVENKNERFLAVRIQKMIFGEKLPSSW